MAGTLHSDSTGNINSNLMISSLAPITCIPGSSISFTGQVNSQGQVTLTSAPLNGQVMKISGVVASGQVSTGLLTNGNYTITGGCMGGDSGAIYTYPLNIGTYTGTLAIPGDIVEITLTLQLANLPPDSKGAIALAGSASFTNSAGCGGFTTATVENAEENGFAFGLTLVTNTNTILNLSTDTISGGPCNGMTLTPHINFQTSIS